MHRFRPSGDAAVRGAASAAAARPQVDALFLIDIGLSFITMHEAEGVLTKVRLAPARLLYPPPVQARSHWALGVARGDGPAAW